MSGSILVLGASGMVGRRLVPILAAGGCPVRAATRTPSAGRVSFDWYHKDTHDAAVEGTDAIFLAPPPLEPEAAPHVAEFLNRARSAGVRRVVLVSSMGVAFAAEPENSDRCMIEAYARASGMAWTILRPSGFMQNFSEGFLFPGIRNYGLVRAAAGNGLVSLVDAGDIARVAAAVLTGPGHDGACYDVTGAEPVSFGDAVAVIGAATGRRIAYEAIAGETMLAILKEARLPEAYAAMLVRDQIGIRDGDAAAVSDTVDRITGRRPVSFNDFVADTAASWTAA